MAKKIAALIPEKMVTDDGYFPRDEGSVRNIDGLVPYNGSFKFFPPLVQGTNLDLGVASGGTFPGFGLHVHKESSGLYRLFVAKASTIYRSTNTNDISAWTDATGGAIAAAATTDSGWQFHSYGTSIYAVNGASTQPIIYASSPTSAFANAVTATAPVSYDPRPKFITSMKNRMVIANVSFAAAPSVANPASQLTGTSYPSLVMISAFDNPGRYGDPLGTPDAVLSGSDIIHLNDDNGAITGIIGGDDIYVFKQTAIYRIARVDGPPYFSVYKVADGVGTRYPFAIRRDKNSVYFFSDDGLFEINTLTGQISNLTKECGCSLTLNQRTGTVGTQFFPTEMKTPTTPIDVSLEVDARSQTILIQVIAADNTSVSNIRKYFIYSIEDKKLTILSKSVASTAWDVANEGFTDYDLLPQARFLKYYPITGDKMPVPYSSGVSVPDVFAGIFMIRCSRGGGNTYVQLTAAESTSLAAATMSHDSCSFGIVGFGYRKFGDTGSSRILRVRPVYWTGLSSGTFNMLCDVRVSTITRAPGEQIITNSLYDPVNTTFQNAGGWIEIDGTWGEEHDIRISVMPYGATGGSTTGPTYMSLVALITNYVSSFLTLEIEYDDGAGDPEGFYA